MKKLISKLFSVLGLEIYKKRPKKNIVFTADQPPCYIELIGVSGVGKSSFYQKLLKNQKRFWTIQDFKNSIPKVDTNYLTDGSSFYQKLAKEQWQYIQKLNILETDKLRMTHWNYKTLTEDALISKFNKNSILLSDEGILHNFQNSLLKIQESHPAELKEFLKNRAVIYCFADKEKIVNQIIQRQNETGRIVSHHKSKTKEELLKLVEKELNEKEEFLKFIELEGVRVLRVNMQDNPTINHLKIKEYLKL